ncbi:glycosyltransferase family 4 protein [Halorussus salinus]|uniref:glycosyltransferase family 4 protein n=1 Tax=Halorussus salinus TaxID=1364935 RepID=UPI00109196F5|nr:glycosyltransferase family 4 protein [Halorussus salinus]
MTRIAFFTGSKSAFNILFDTLNFGWMLHNDYELDLITTKPDELGPLANYFEMHGGNFPSTRVGETRALHNYLKYNRPEVIVNVVEPSIHGNIVGALATHHGIPFTYRYSGDLLDLYRVSHGWRKPAQFMLNNIFGRLAISTADKFIALGPTGKKRLTDHGATPSDVEILPPPIDNERFKGVEPSDISIPEGRKLVLYAGRRSRIKGMNDMNTAIPEILSRRDDLQFVFVGSHGIEPDVPSRYEDHITMVGRVPLGGMPPYFQAADLLVLPTYNEGLPRVITEALAADTPVVARDVADIAYATQNTFQTIDEFIEMVSSLEDLPLDEMTPFTRTALKENYINFFSQF